MWNYYCEKCKNICDFEEIELREGYFEGEWEEVHILCDSKVELRLNVR